VVEVMTGRVAVFDERRGLGEIEGADGQRYPFHCTQIADGSRTIGVNAAVEFAVTPGGLGRWEAASISPVPAR
jgi:CspA family cold shock protein